MAITTPTRPPAPRSQTGTPADPTVTRGDGGYTLIELVVVVAILGILGSVAWLGATGITSEAAETGCLADARQLRTAVASFVAQTGDDRIPATGTDHDRFERTLVAGDFLDQISTHHDLAADGGLTPEDPSC